ncbi:MAG: MFS transporter [Proteobacteria bacterium]|nr:MFS transporter [Pseudomonadota bacterium]MBI3495970.1 MFS transporter [Pseudomonadota bacterium]
MTDLAVPSLRSRQIQVPVFLVSLGHGATHWIAATFYLLLPFITRDFGLSYAEAGFIVTCFYIGSVAANFPSGAVVDLTGRRILFQIVALIGGSIGLVGVGLAPQYWLIAASVTVIGATNMLWHPPAIAFLSGHLPKNKGYALSVHALGANLGDAMAPLVAGWLLLSVSWRATAGLNAISGIVCAVLLLAVLGRSDLGQRRHVAVMDPSAYLAGFVRAFKARAVWTLCLMAGFRTMTQGGLLVFLPLYIANDLKLNPFWIGVTLMMLQVGGMIATPLAGTLSDRIGRRPIVLAGMMGTTVLVVALAFIGSGVFFTISVSVLGFCMYAMRPVIHSWLMDRSPPELAATMTSAMFGTQSVLSALMPVVGGMIADAYGLVVVFYFLAATVLIANALAFFVPKSETVD